MLRLNKKNYLYYAWLCDYSSSSGEGNLARLFIKKEIVLNNCKIIGIENVFKNRFFKNFFSYKYLSPFIGIIYCWLLFIKKRKVAYINYIPLWNFFIFLLLPPKTLLGPITGGAYFFKRQYYIRRFIFPILYKISEIFLLLRNKKIIFATELLKKNLFNYTIKKAKFNYVFKFYKKRKFLKKNIDFLIYYRRHTNKESTFPINFLKKLIAFNFKIHIIGDYLKNYKVINHGHISNKIVNNLLAKTYFSLSSNENPYTLFNLECFNNNVKVIIEDSFKNNIKHYNNLFLFLDFSKYNLVKNILEKIKIDYKNEILKN